MPGTPADWLQDAKLPVAMMEGEFKGIAVCRLSHHDTETARFLPIAISGCWSWRGVVGKAPGPNGERTAVKGPIADLDRLTWEGRLVYLVPDTNMTTNPSVAARGATWAGKWCDGARTSSL